MTQKKQVQKADNSQQAGRDIINYNGLSAGEAIEIIDRKADALRKEFDILAGSIANKVISLFNERATERLTGAEVISAFAQPDFQYNVYEAQRSAIRSGNEEDIDLLVSILEERAKVLPTPRYKLATRKALEVVGQLPQEYINRLTVMWYGLHLTVQRTTSLRQVLDFHDTNLSSFLKNDFPETTGWLMDLAILDCIQVSAHGLGGLKSFTAILEAKYPGFFASGFSKEVANDFREKLLGVKQGLESLIIEHPIDKGKFCLLGSNKVAFMDLLKHNGVDLEQEKAIIDEMIKQNQYENKSSQAEQYLKDLIKDFPTLYRLSRVWDQDYFPSTQITPVGVVIAFSNFKHVLPNVEVPSFQSLFD